MFFQFEYFSSLFFCLGIVTVSSLMVSHNPKDVHFYLFSNRRDFDECYELPFDSIPHISSGFLPLFGTRIIVHGFADSVFSNRTIGAIKDAYLISQLPGNTIMVAWNKLAATGLFNVSDPPSYMGPTYKEVALNMPIVGGRVANFILNYMRMGLLRPDLIHLIGHSLGAHICAYTGTHFRTVSGFPIARITGLEPALHVFEISDVHIGRDNATFVDVIHCNWGGYGVNYTCGDVDFFPNGGQLQPGCGHPVSGFNNVCSHSFAIDLYAASISNPLVACRCPLRVGATFSKCRDPVYMGLYCSPYARYEYCLQTPRNPF